MNSQGVDGLTRRRKRVAATVFAEGNPMFFSLLVLMLLTEVCTVNVKREGDASLETWRDI